MAHELKLYCYCKLQVECQENGWSCYNIAVGVRARGAAAHSLIKAVAAIGMRDRVQKTGKGCGYRSVPLFKMAVLVVRKEGWERRP